MHIMKKNLWLIGLASVYSLESYALTIYERNGTTLRFSGEMNMVLEKQYYRTHRYPLNETLNESMNTNLANNGSEIRFKAKHKLSDELSLFARVGWNLNNYEKNATRDRFGELSVRRAYLGIEHQKYGQLRIGRQSLFANEISVSDFDYSVGNSERLLAYSGKSVIRYDYTGIENLQLSSHYHFSEKTDSFPRQSNRKLKDGVGIAGLYDISLNDRQAFSIGAAYSYVNYLDRTNQRASQEGAQLSLLLFSKNWLFGLDTGLRYRKQPNLFEDEKLFLIKSGIRYAYSDQGSVYTNCAYSVAKRQNLNLEEEIDRIVRRSAVFGTDYSVHQNVSAYLEAGYAYDLAYSGGNKLEQGIEKIIASGLEIYW
ncbi:porin [Actinobacillus suis]|uniref:Outer membrane protein P2 (OMP P2) n=3 Tax=Actinobacillus suis TaxID=716 RepID=K0FV90_ACTSU|nr:porin [Actinobacillus suis]AIJ30383.1 outer membrane protein P2 (OMP P2) [Actinobacillus suis ATCC 33415]AFU18247.1 outer membrane protein P2 (OMP P2) [Actinobacillus suis H91-0380]MCO4167459.1 porin [Actinobacillus suis]MCO4170149.1 porin [Actinobacillus suis]MCQ9630919.1 porin [Actinobacillus suis]